MLVTITVSEKQIRIKGYKFEQWKSNNLTPPQA